MLIRIDKAIQDWTDRCVWRLDAKEIHAPQVLRELISGTIASNALMAVAATVQSLWLAVPVICASILFTWWSLPQWRQHAADAKKEWTPDLAAAYARRALAKQQFHGRSRPLMLLSLAPYCLVLSMFATTQYGFFYLALLLRMIVLVGTIYMECGMPVPPAPRSRLVVPSAT